MAGGHYSLAGGFWALIQVVETPGLPLLTITRAGNSVIVSWPDPATNSYTLQQNGNRCDPRVTFQRRFTPRNRGGPQKQ